MKVKTLEEALEFVESVDMCTIFSGKVKGVPALWEVVDLPENGGGRTRWGAKVEAVWAWKNELPETYPDDIFYGKLPGGHAVLMTIDYLVGTHYPKAYKPVEACSELAQQVYEIIRLNPNTTGSSEKRRCRCTVVPKANSIRLLSSCRSP